MNEQYDQGSLWSRLWRRPSKRWLLGIPVGAFLTFFAGAVAWAGFEQFVRWSNTESFCISCHEMRDTVYQEYKESTHYKNASGVRAICSDCHVPEAWLPKLWRKIRATNELFHKVAGTIDTPEKFEAKRAELAENVWRSMRATDSRECRNCHTLEDMNLEVQDSRAAQRHSPERRAEKGETCIDCHEGLVHKLPEL